MKPKMEVKNEIFIRATAPRVWQVLTDPAITPQYMYGCAALSDWEVGSPLLWEGEYAGQKMIFVKGVVEEYQPPERLKYSVFDPQATYADIPANHLHVTYLVSETSDGVRLTVIQDGFETAAEGEKRYTEVYNQGLGWQPILEEIKRLAEAG